MFQRIVTEVFKWFPWKPTMQVVMLGVDYDTSDAEQRDKFLEDFRSRIQLTYRSGMSTPLKLVSGKNIDSDAGWGCMLRVTQMMIAETLVDLVLGRTWRYQEDQDLVVGSAYLDIVACFLDTPTAPFSLHRLVDAGQRLCGKEPSTWFGPTSAARATGHLFETLAQGDGGADGVSVPSLLQGIACVVFEDGAIFKASVTEKFDQGAKAVIILVCRRLGLESFNLEEYRGGVEECFKLPEFQGLASGNSGSSAHFFVGTHDDCLIFLDPHTTLPAIESIDTVREVPDCGLHTPHPLPLRWNRLNPSISLCFLVKSPESFADLCTKLGQGSLGQVFEVLEKQPSYATRGEETMDDDMVLLD